jgi:NOL1/NOP2/fmu family ribosome biogenesis protein
MKIIYSTAKKRILEKLKEQYGIEKLPYLLLQFGKEKITIFSGSLSSEELRALDRNIRIETAGLYAIKEQKEELRLTLDGTQILKNQITKNVLEINDKQAEEWFRRNDLYIKTNSAFKILKNKEDFIGSGKSTGDRITNFIPKERRIKDEGS